MKDTYYIKHSPYEYISAFNKLMNSINLSYIIKETNNYKYCGIVLYNYVRYTSEEFNNFDECFASIIKLIYEIVFKDIQNPVSDSFLDFLKFIDNKFNKEYVQLKR